MSHKIEQFYDQTFDAWGFTIFNSLVLDSFITLVTISLQEDWGSILDEFLDAYFSSRENIYLREDMKDEFLT